MRDFAKRIFNAGKENAVVDRVVKGFKNVADYLNLTEKFGINEEKTPEKQIIQTKNYNELRFESDINLIRDLEAKMKIKSESSFEKIKQLSEVITNYTSYQVKINPDKNKTKDLINSSDEEFDPDAEYDIEKRLGKIIEYQSKHYNSKVDSNNEKPFIELLKLKTSISESLKAQEDIDRQELKELLGAHNSKMKSEEKKQEEESKSTPNQKNLSSQIMAKGVSMGEPKNGINKMPQKIPQIFFDPDEEMEVEMKNRENKSTDEEKKKSDNAENMTEAKEQAQPIIRKLSEEQTPTTNPEPQKDALQTIRKNSNDQGNYL
ncbi:MAG: hypothetical protein K0R25_727 [Rickettsiaceae bacterium]|jgi:hypothetical protein|nr:hypothetical protein [Rickettsiaceae bacterium]